MQNSGTGGKEPTAPRRSSRSRSAGGGTSSGNDEIDTGPTSTTKSKSKSKRQQGETALSDAEENKNRVAAGRTVSFVEAGEEKTGGTESTQQNRSETSSQDKRKSLQSPKGAAASSPTVGEHSARVQDHASFAQQLDDNIRGMQPELSWLLTTPEFRDQSHVVQAGSARDTRSSGDENTALDQRQPYKETTRTLTGEGMSKTQGTGMRAMAGGGVPRNHPQEMPSRQNLEALMEQDAQRQRQRLTSLLQGLSERKDGLWGQQQEPGLKTTAASAPLENDNDDHKSPRGTAAEELTTHELEKVTDPVVQSLLRKLANQFRAASAAGEQADPTNSQRPKKRGDKGTHASTVDTHAKQLPHLANKEASKQSRENKIPSREVLSLLTKCPTCGKENRKIPGDPLVHYLVCNNRKTNFTLTTSEMEGLKLISGLRRNIKKNETRHANSHQLVRESRRQEREARRAGERDLHSTDSERSASSEEGVRRNKDGYESNSGSEDEDADGDEGDEDEEDEESEYQDSGSSSGSGSESPEQPNSRRQRHSSPARSSPEKQRSDFEILEIQELKRQISDQQHVQNDTTSLIRQLFQQVKEISQSVQRLSVPPSTMTVTPSATRHENSRQESVSASSYHDRGVANRQAPQQHDNRLVLWGAQDDYSPRSDERHTDPGDQNFPEVTDEELAVAAAFEKHKKAYRGYLSKCSSNRRRAVSLAQTFEKWAEWIAVVFTEQEKQKSEAQGSGHHRFFTKATVLHLENEDFEARYLEMCGLSLREPSQVLDFLREVTVDVSTGTVPKIIAASESFRVKLRQIPSRALLSTTAERVRNAFVESLFGEERGKRKRVDYDHLDTWEDVTRELTKAAARSTTGLAFEPFKTLPGLKSVNQSPAQKASVEEAETEGTRGCDMRIVSEQKWFKRYKYFANKHKIPLEQHGGSTSWKTRYIHVVDVVDAKSGRCTLCERKGHIASACGDPSPDVLYPTVKPSRSHSSEGSRRNGRFSEERQRYRPDNDSHKGNQRDQRDRQYGRDDRDPSQPRREYRDERHDQRRDSTGRDTSYRGGNSDRGDYRSNSGSRYRDSSRERSDHRERRDSQERDHDPARRHDRDSISRTPPLPRHRDEEIHSPRAPSLRPGAARDGSREPSRERSRERDDRGDRSRRITCYRCGHEGHIAKDCSAKKDRDGRTLADE
jgi:hypothetical protein